MVILPCFEFFFSGSNYVSFVFLLSFVFSLIFKIVRG